MKLLLLHPASFQPAAITEALRREGIETRSVTSLGEGVPSETAAAFLLDPSSRAAFAPDGMRGFVQSGGAIVALGAPGEIDVPPDLTDDLLAAFVPAPHSLRQILIALRTAFREAAAVSDSVRTRLELGARSKEIGELSRIGMALATERDYHTLLGMILDQARHIASSDGASLYLVESLDDGTQQLRFKLAYTFSRPDTPFVEFTVPMDRRSIAGYVATTGEPLTIDDAYYLAPDVPYSINRSFDERSGYRTKSLLTIPMKDHQDRVIGVLQLVNRTRRADTLLQTPEDVEREVIPYSRRVADLVASLAGQAAVSIENSQLYESIERLFEGFVRAAVTAIEQRDPTTFGHSGRVAAMTVGLAEAVDRTQDGPYRDVRFTREDLKEVRYAGLLHDFGKVGVREQVLVKAKKLYEPDLRLIRQRHAFIRRTSERDFHQQRAEYLERHGQTGYQEFLAGLMAEHERQIAELDRFVKLVLDSNEPNLLPEGNFQHLKGFAETYYQDLDGGTSPYLSPDEVRFLSIRKGSLDDAERQEIESHVTHTYRFLLQIPWTKELEHVPVIAYGHHEKLDGTGYPRKVGGPEIPIQTRMMTIADIYDALTAQDRPYKPAVPRDRALDIMAQEVKGGMLDRNLFELFRLARVFERRDV